MTRVILTEGWQLFSKVTFLALCILFGVSRYAAAADCDSYAGHFMYDGICLEHCEPNVCAGCSSEFGLFFDDSHGGECNAVLELCWKDIVGCE